MGNSSSSEGGNSTETRRGAGNKHESRERSKQQSQIVSREAAPVAPSYRTKSARPPAGSQEARRAQSKY
ncbi:hypothetical protein VTL71DRAFT_2479 [Oculimacula yallundae]|uniref:Uncharacterized protein n=1 Tax=Oculimacula yallundae TaxID=86028 RepID=A0ABR4C8Y1_9HELO